MRRDRQLSQTASCESKQRKLTMIATVQTFPLLPMPAAATRHSKLFFILLGLAGASLIADVGLLVGAVVIH